MLALMTCGLLLCAASSLKHNPAPKYSVVVKMPGLRGALKSHTIESGEADFFTGGNLRSKCPGASFCHPDTQRELQDGEKLSFAPGSRRIVLPSKTVEVVDISFGDRTKIAVCPADGDAEAVAKYRLHRGTSIPFAVCKEDKADDGQLCVMVQGSSTVEVPLCDGTVVKVAHSAPLFAHSVRHVAAKLLGTSDRLVALCTGESDCELQDWFIAEGVTFNKPSYVVVDVDVTKKIPLCSHSTLPYCNEFKRGRVCSAGGCDPVLLKRVVAVHPALLQRHFKLKRVGTEMSSFLNDGEDYSITPIPIEFLDVKTKEAAGKQDDHKRKYKRQISILRGSAVLIAVFVAANVALFVWASIRFSTDAQ